MPEQAQESKGGRLHAIGAQIALLQARFSRNLFDAVAAWSKDLVDETRLGGVPLRAREKAREAAQSAALAGVRLTLDTPAYEAVMRHADDRELRREIYEAYATRASDRGPLSGRFDNGLLIDEILSLRHELANDLGFRNYVEAVVKTGIAGSADDAERLLLELNSRLRPRGQEELEEIWKFAKAVDGIKGFRPWDLTYYVERLARDRSGFSTPALLGIREIELALFDLRLHRDYVPEGRASKLRSHVLDTLAQARREVNLLPPPPWDRAACSFVEMFGDGSAASPEGHRPQKNEVGGYYYARVLAQSDAT